MRRARRQQGVEQCGIEIERCRHHVAVGLIPERAPRALDIKSLSSILIATKYATASTAGIENHEIALLGRARLDSVARPAYRPLGRQHHLHRGRHRRRHPDHPRRRHRHLRAGAEPAGAPAGARQHLHYPQPLGPYPRLAVLYAFVPCRQPRAPARRARPGQRQGHRTRARRATAKQLFPGRRSTDGGHHRLPHAGAWAAGGGRQRRDEPSGDQSRLPHRLQRQVAVPHRRP